MDELQKRLIAENACIVISSYDMQAIKGADALALTRRHNEHIPFIIVSGQIEVEAAVQALKMGANNFIHKDSLPLLAPLVLQEIQDSAKNRDKQQVLSALNESEKRYRMLAENMADTLLLINPDGIITFATPSSREVFGIADTDILHNSLYDIIDMRDHGLLVHAFTILKTKEKQMGIVLRLRSDENRWTDCRLRYLTDEQKYLLIGRDISERKQEEKRQLEEKLTQQLNLMNAVVEVQENERRRLSEELHDGIGPILSAVRMNISSTESYTDQDGKDGKLLHNATRLLDDSLMELRNLAKNLIPPALHDYGLYRALRNFCEKNDRLKDIRIQYRIKEPEWNLNSVAEITAYRVSQELINNALKYSKAANIFLEVMPMVYRSKDFLRLRVQDDGVGFEFSQNFDKEKGMGLRNIASRVHLLGGKFVVETAPGKGSTFVIDLPRQTK